jgi:hypothetical protein
MGIVRRIDVTPADPQLTTAVQAFLADMPNPNTARACVIALRAWPATPAPPR